ncbi:MAG: TRAP transporter substrate-binding protein [Hyphomonadaceae bacterium]|nr:TRAP transporter substrate-binding protein [Hyphomonadaceae bacterium]
MRRRALLAAAASAGLGACGATPGARPLYAADTHPGDYPTVAAVGWFAEEVARRSHGRLGVRQYPGGQLGEEKDTLELTIFGGVDINRVNLAPLNAIAPETIVPTLPFLFRSEAHMRAAMAGDPGKAVFAALRRHRLIGLCFYDSGARSFYTTRRPVLAPGDLRGMKIRVQNSDVFVAMVDALGGDATPMSYGEVYGALLQGVVDGAENNWPSYESSRHFEAAKHYSLTRHVIAPEALVMSARRWDKLAPEDQALIAGAAADSVAVMAQLWTERETGAEARLRAAGVSVAEPPDRDAFARLMAPVWARFLRAGPLRRLSEDILALGAAP